MTTNESINDFAISIELLYCRYLRMMVTENLRRTNGLPRTNDHTVTRQYVAVALCCMHAFTCYSIDAYVPSSNVLIHSGRRSSPSWPLFSAVSRKESSLDEHSRSIAETVPSDAASRFHMDMRRVLRSRNDMALSSSDSASSTSSVLDSYSPMERRKRPTVLTQDVDGAIRVTSMLRHMVNIGVATEESFQILLEALCQRGRLRWRNKDAMVVCAADEVEGILEELWDRQDGNVSTETCNLVLKAYASCSTPRGNRRYAQKAQSLLSRMEENDIPSSIESYSHVINAWAWQQGNLDD